jgi:hypothetical protein
MVVKLRKLRWARHVYRMVGNKKCINNFGGGDFLENIHPEDQEKRWEPNIVMNLSEINFEDGR